MKNFNTRAFSLAKNVIITYNRLLFRDFTKISGKRQTSLIFTKPGNTFHEETVFVNVRAFKIAI